MSCYGKTVNFANCDLQTRKYSYKSSDDEDLYTLLQTRKIYNSIIQQKGHRREHRLISTPRAIAYLRDGLCEKQLSHQK